MMIFMTVDKIASDEDSREKDIETMVVCRSCDKSTYNC